MYVSRYDGSLDIWMVKNIITTKFKSLVISMSIFALPRIANIFIFMILNDFCLLPE
jgi:hypothetical protein